PRLPLPSPSGGEGVGAAVVASAGIPVRGARPGRIRPGPVAMARPGGGGGARRPRRGPSHSASSERRRRAGDGPSPLLPRSHRPGSAPRRRGSLPDRQRPAANRPDVGRQGGGALLATGP